MMPTRVLALVLLLLGFAFSALAQAPTPLCTPTVNQQSCTSVGPQIGSAGTLASSAVLKSSTGVLEGFGVSIVGATASMDYWVMVFDLAAAPTNGATVAPSHTYLASTNSGGNGQISVVWPPSQYERYSNGIVLGLSSTCCTTFTAVAKGNFGGNVN